MHFKRFFSLILKEKELKTIVLKTTLFYCNFFLVLYIPKQIYAFQEKKNSKKKQQKNNKSFLPTYPNFFRL